MPNPSALFSFSTSLSLSIFTLSILSRLTTMVFISNFPLSIYSISTLIRTLQLPSNVFIKLLLAKLASLASLSISFYNRVIILKSPFWTSIPSAPYLIAYSNPLPSVFESRCCVILYARSILCDLAAASYCICIWSYLLRQLYSILSQYSLEYP